MSALHIDPGDGPHAAADLSDDALAYLLPLVTWELALRAEPEDSDQTLRQVLEARSRLDEAIEAARRERELMVFATEVMADLEQLPVTIT